VEKIYIGKRLDIVNGYVVGGSIYTYVPAC